MMNDSDPLRNPDDLSAHEFLKHARRLGQRIDDQAVKRSDEAMQAHEATHHATRKQAEELVSEGFREIAQANRAEMYRIAEEVVRGHLGKNAATDPLRIMEVRALSEVISEEIDQRLADLETRLMARIVPVRKPRRSRREVQWDKAIDAVIEEALVGFGETEDEATA